MFTYGALRLGAAASPLARQGTPAQFTPPQFPCRAGCRWSSRTTTPCLQASHTAWRQRQLGHCVLARANVWARAVLTKVRTLHAHREPHFEISVSSSPCHRPEVRTPRQAKPEHNPASVHSSVPRCLFDSGNVWWWTSANVLRSTRRADSISSSHAGM